MSFSRNEHTLGERNEKRCLKLKILVCSAIQHHSEGGTAGMALGEAAGNGRNAGGALSCCWTTLSSSDTWHKKGLKSQVFPLPGSWVRGIRELDAESWLGDEEFQIRGSHKAKLFPPPDTKFPSFPLFQSLVSISPHYSLTSEGKYWYHPADTGISYFF